MSEYKNTEDTGAIVSEPAMNDNSTCATTVDMVESENTRREVFMKHWNRGMTIEEFRVHCDKKLRQMYGVDLTERIESNGEDIFD